MNVIRTSFLSALAKSSVSKPKDRQVHFSGKKQIFGVGMVDMTDEQVESGRKMISFYGFDELPDDSIPMQRAMFNIKLMAK